MCERDARVSVSDAISGGVTHGGFGGGNRGVHVAALGEMEREPRTRAYLTRAKA